MVVMTPTVEAVMGDAVLRAAAECASSVDLCVIAVNEATKTMDAVETVSSRALEIGLEREAVIVGLGGGVCTDIVTVAASLVRRGLQHVRLPTTLIGLVDAGIGVKGAVNSAGQKSALGVFHPPSAVFIDGSTLATLPRKYLSDGLAEITKVALLSSPELFEMVAADPSEVLSTRFQCRRGEQLIALSIDAMIRELQPNLYEDRTYARHVDFGHTFSPLLEATNGFQLSHGAAVAVDIVLSSAIAVELGTLEADEFDRVVETLLACGLPIVSDHLTLELCRHAMVAAQRHRGGHLNLVVPNGLGSVSFVQDVPSLGASVLPAALRRLRSTEASDASRLLETGVPVL
jgi:2-epi-5-epi-valiolone synthase